MVNLLTEIFQQHGYHALQVIPAGRVAAVVVGTSEIKAVVCNAEDCWEWYAYLYQAVDLLAARFVFYMVPGDVPENIERMIRDSGQPVLDKPFDLHKLLEAVESV